MPHPDRIVMDTISVSPVDARGNRGDQRYWVAKRGRQYLGARWATRHEARMWALDLMREDAGLIAAGTADVRTVLDLLEVWWASVETDPTLAKKTVTSYMYSLRHLDDAAGGEALSTFDEDAFKRAYASLLRLGFSEGTAQQDLRVLSVCWHWARKRRPPLVAHDFPRAKLPKPGAANNKRTPEAAEIERVIAHSRGNTKTALILLYATGARAGEVCGLEWGRVDWARQEVTVIGKTGPRTIPLGAGTMDHLDRVRETGRERPVTARTVGQQITAACGRAGVIPFTAHGIRRHVVDRLYRQTDPGTASAILGHSPKVALEHYRRATGGDTRAALEATGLSTFRPADALAFSPRGNNGGTNG